MRTCCRGHGVRCVPVGDEEALPGLGATFAALRMPLQLCSFAHGLRLGPVTMVVDHVSQCIAPDGATALNVVPRSAGTLQRRGVCRLFARSLSPARCRRDFCTAPLFGIGIRRDAELGEPGAAGGLEAGAEGRKERRWQMEPRVCVAFAEVARCPPRALRRVALRARRLAN